MAAWQEPFSLGFRVYLWPEKPTFSFLIMVSIYNFLKRGFGGQRKVGCKFIAKQQILQTVSPSPDWAIKAREPYNTLLRGSWDLVTRVITKVTILIITYNPT